MGRRRAMALTTIGGMGIVRPGRRRDGARPTAAGRVCHGLRAFRGFRSHLRHGARPGPGRDRATRPRVGGCGHHSARPLAEDGGTRLRRPLRLRGARRQRPHPPRRDPCVRGAVDGVPLGRGLPVNPQHVRADDRQLRFRGPEGPGAAARRLHGDSAELLPDRARLGLRRGGAADARRARARRLAADGDESVHLGRRLFGRLHRHGAVGSGGAEGHLRLSRP